MRLSDSLFSHSSTGEAARLTLTAEPITIATDRGYDQVIAALATYEPSIASISDPTLERKERFMLESLGLRELEYLSDCSLPPDSQAEYLVGFDNDATGICSFGRFAIPQLEKQGWTVDVHPDYPWKVIDEEAPWYSSLSQKDNDWFSLELGVRVQGKRVNLMPALLEILGQTSNLEDLCRGRRKIVPLEVSPGTYLAVPGSQLKGVMQTLVELYRGDTNEILIHRTDPMTQQDGEDVIFGTSAKRRTTSAATTSLVAKVAAPHGLKATLRPYQEEGLAWMQDLRAKGTGGIMADDMGLGKTLQTIAHILKEIESGRTKDCPTLIVAPTSLLHNWVREFGKFAPSVECQIHHGTQRTKDAASLRKPDIIVTTYALAHRDLELLQTIDWYYVVLDEAHYIKNSSGQSHRSICEIPAKHRLALTGTPIENNIGELWSIFHFAQPQLLGSLGRFRHTYQNPIESGQSEWKLESLRKLIDPFVMRRLKEDVAKELPSKTVVVRAIELDEPQRHLYESIRLAAHKDVRTTIRKRGFNQSTIAILDALLKLRQACCDPRLVKIPSARRVKSSAKLDTLLELVERQLNQQRRILIFSQFTKMLDIISLELKKKSITHLKLTGSSTNRQRIVDQFDKGVANVFLLSLKAAGVGLNLVSADTVIHYDPWWNPTTQAQATDRAYRIGQKKPVVVYKLITAGSVEERMLQIQEKKRSLAEAMIGPGSAPLRLSEDDINDLFTKA